MNIKNNSKKITKPTLKLDDNVEFLESGARNWRWGKVINISVKNNATAYKIYSGTDIFWARHRKDGPEKYILESF
jgi:hypothetical protein